MQNIFSQSVFKTNPTIFSRKKLEVAARAYRIDTIEGIEEKKNKLAGWIKGIQDGSVTSKKEEAIDHDFLNLFFGEILDYDWRQGEEQLNLEKQNKNQTDSKKADGALGYFNQKTGEKTVRAVIELKDGQTDLDKPQNRKNDHRTPVQQAFDYASDAGGTCNWVIVSNFVEIRLYNYRDRGKYELFYITEFLDNEVELKRFFYLLYKGQLISQKESFVDKLYNERSEEQVTITNKFYEEYKKLRLEIYNNLRSLNPDIDHFVLLNKTQKLLDRIIFVCFCEDAIPELIPGSTIAKLIASSQENPFYTPIDPIWQHVKGLFKAMNVGNTKARIEAFNGGLFAHDEILENLLIDEIVLENVLNLYKWDFESELNVNILGHIFEQSISDLEKISIEISQQLTADGGSQTIFLDENALESKSKRKKEGVFYTPEYITSYIIEETIGTWIWEQKLDLKFDTLEPIEPKEYADLERFDKQTEARKKELTEKISPHREFWLAFKYRLDRIRILDPACGSGAFLVQAFDYLYKQQQIIQNEILKLRLDKLQPAIRQDWWDIQKHILSDNLYGVDLNFESIEITKLSLWIKTANRKKKLSFIDNNIICGNSLVADPAIAGEKALDWNVAFKDILEESGFDIVVGNPPYVRQELLGKANKEYYTKQFPNVGNGTADLYVYFYELGLKVLKPNGLLGFITPNKWFKTLYGKELRQFLKPYNVLKVIDFFELDIFEEAATEPQILLIKNTINDSDFPYYSVLEVNQFIKKDIFNHGGKFLINIEKKYLQSSEWTFASIDTQLILNKISQNAIFLSQYSDVSIYRGVITGLNEAFIIDTETKNKIVKSDPKSGELIKPYINGTDSKAWHVENEGDTWFINTYFDTEISSKTYKGIYNHLKQYEKELKNRQDKGKTHFNLRACDYYDKFSQPKIIYIYTALEHYFYFDTSGLYFNNSSYMISNGDLFLSCWLNSPIFNFYKKQKFVAYGNAIDGGRNKLDYNKMVNVPIPIVSESTKKEFEEIAVKLQTVSQELYKKSAQFISLFMADVAKPQLSVSDAIASSDGISRISKRFRNWYLHDFDWFLSIAKKEKITLPLKQKAEWQSHFTDELKLCNQLNDEITILEQNLNQKIYQLYDLTSEEIKVVEGS